MACSTCHVVVDNEWYGKVGAPCEAEQDMLDLAYEPTVRCLLFCERAFWVRLACFLKETSRLGCMVRLGKELNGVKIRVPRGANNLFDHIPFED